MYLTENIEVFIHRILGFICHQDPSLNLIVQEHSLPLCPRCIGMHFGFYLTIAYLLFLKKSTRFRLLDINLIILLLPVGLMGLEWLLSNLHIINSSITSRLISGFIGGVSSGAFLVVFAIRFSLKIFLQYNKNITYYLLIPVLLILVIPAIFSPLSYWFFLNLLLAYIVIVNLITAGIILIQRVQLMIQYNKYSIS